MGGYCCNVCGVVWCVVYAVRSLMKNDDDNVKKKCDAS